MLNVEHSKEREAFEVIYLDNDFPYIFIENCINYK
jgi:hypothetical protein